MIDAALKIPVEVSIKLVEATCKAAEDGALLLCLDEASDFCAKLALEGKGDAAKQLADSLFTPKFIGKISFPQTPCFFELWPILCFLFGWEIFVFWGDDRLLLELRLDRSFLFCFCGLG